MEYKQLYNLEDDTLITLYPSLLRLEVKGEFVHNYQLDAVSFTIIFLLCASRPEFVTDKELKEILGSIGVTMHNAKDLERFTLALQRKLNSYKVKNFIIHIKRKGYGISKLWVDPINAKKKPKKFMTYIKKIYGLVNTSSSNIERQ